MALLRDAAAVLRPALYVRMIRATVGETLQEDYVGFARAKGMSEWGVRPRSTRS